MNANGAVFINKTFRGEINWNCQYEQYSCVDKMVDNTKQQLKESP